MIAAASTSSPVPTVNNDSSRTAVVALSTMPLIVATIRLRSMAETVGNCFTMSACALPEAVAFGARVTITLNVGAASSTPVGNTTKKFGSKRLQSTLRMLPTLAANGMPCTSKPSASPTLTCNSLAMSSSTETGTGWAASRPAPGVA